MTDYNITDVDVADAVRVLNQMTQRGGNTSPWYQVIGDRKFGRGYHLDQAYPMFTFNDAGEVNPDFYEYGGGHNDYTSMEDREEATNIATELLRRARTETI